MYIYINIHTSIEPVREQTQFYHWGLVLRHNVSIFGTSKPHWAYHYQHCHFETQSESNQSTDFTSDLPPPGKSQLSFRQLDVAAHHLGASCASTPQSPQGFEKEMIPWQFSFLESSQALAFLPSGPEMSSSWDHPR